MVGRALKRTIVATILSGALAVAGCTTVAPRVEPTPGTKHQHRAKAVRTTAAPNFIKHKKVTATKLIKPVQNEAPPVVTPLGGGSGGGSSGGGSSW